MALEQPVIAYDIGGTKEIIKDKDNGILITDESDFQISKIITELVDNIELRDKLGKRGRKLIEKSFTLDEMGRKYMQIYESMSK